MAAEVTSMPNGNGYAPHQGYGGPDQHQQHHSNAFTNNSNNSSANSYSQAPPATPSTPATSSSQQSDIPKDEVGWYFVEQYYTTLSRSPEKLYLFYNKRSQFVSGQETDKVAVCVGQRAINDRIKELDFQDCKVRVTNVDSQASDANIVIQVIGEISNKSQAHKKFTQTFVLATQTNGYFVLNDIFRYLIEEEDEAEAEPEAAPAQSASEEVKSAPAVESTEPEPAAALEEAEPKTLTSSLNPAAVEHDAQAVDKELEEQLSKEPAKSEGTLAPAVNGVAESEQQEADHTEEAPATSVAELDAAAPANDLETVPSAESDVQPEAPKDPEPTPAVSPPKQVAAQPAAPAKPTGPKTWASLAASAHRVATPATPSTPSSAQSRPAQSTAPSTSSVPKAATPTPAVPASSVPSAPAAPAAQREEPSSAQDEWNTVGGSHNRQQSRQMAPQAEPIAQNQGYIKNVYENVDFAELKAHLSQFGEIVYFDIARPKNCAFVNYKTADGYNAAVAANPHAVGNDKFYVEERRIRPGSTPFIPRGQFQGGRGGRGGAGGPGAPRGNFQGGRGGYPPRGGRGGAGGAPAAGRGRGGASGAPAA